MTTTFRSKLLMMGIVVGALTPAAAHAQAGPAGGYFARDRNTSVRERPRPEYEAVGIRTGAFTVYPRIGFDVGYTDNIYASESNKTADAFWRVRPEVSAVSNWRRHLLAGFARASSTNFANQRSENSTDYAIGVNGRLDITRAAQATGSATYQYLTEPRSAATSPGNASRPVRYSLAQQQLGLVYELGRIRLTGKLDHADYNYRNVPRTGGGFILEDDRDRNEWVERGRGEYAISPFLSVFAEAATNQRRYRLSRPAVPFDRDSDGYDVSIGSSVDISAFIRGEIQVGYLSQDYADPRFRSLRGLSARGSLDWFPTQLTSVNLTLARTVEEAASIASPGGLRTSANLRVDHELRRNIVLTGQLGYAGVDYVQIDRSDRIVSAGVSAGYLLSRRAGVRVGYDYTDRVSKGADRYPDFTENRLLVSLNLQY